MKRILLLFGMLIVFSFCSKQKLLAQEITEYDFSASRENYIEISGGNIVSNSTSIDNQFFNNIAIGFDFAFAGQVFSEIGISTNGYASFSNVANNAISYPLFSGVQNSISPLSGDLSAQAGSSITTSTVGTSPNRVFTVQWKNYTWSGLSANYNFQIKLYEVNNSIAFHYGAFSHPGGATDRLSQVCINALDGDFVNRVGANNNWNTTNTTNSTNPGIGIPLQTNIRPSNNLKFTFSPIPTDLGINLLPNVAALCGEQEFNYLLEVVNSSNTANTNIEVDFPIPAGTSFSSSNASIGTYDENTGFYSIGNLEGNETASLEVVLTVDPGMEGSNVLANAEILRSDAGDTDISDNDASVNLAISTNISPQLSDIIDQSVAYNSISFPIAFTASDAETTADDLIISITSSNQTLIPNANISETGTGTNRQIVLEPALNQFGTSAITVEVSDGECAIIKSFEVEVFKQAFNNFEAAKIVVGQPDFTSGNTNATSVNAPGSNSSSVSVKGVLAVGSQTANRVLIWNSVPTSDGEPADIVVGQTNFTSTVVGTSSRNLRNPDGVAFSPDGNKLIVADALNHRVLIWNAIPTTNNQPANIVIGQTNFTDNNPGTAANKFNRPTDVQITASGKMIVTDRNNHRILIFNKIPTTNNASADIVIGQTNFTNNGWNTRQNRLRLPWNTAVAPDGKFLIADNDNNRVLIYNTIPTTNGAPADVVIGQNSFNTRNIGNSRTELNYIAGVTVSPTGLIALADFRNNRVLIYESVPTTNGASADVVLGQPDFNQTFEFNNGLGGIGTPSNRNMSQPYGINFDLNERIFLNGRGMNRLMIFGETPTQTTDLSIAFSSDSNSPCVNSLVSYEVILSNNGPINATNVAVTTALPDGFTPVESLVERGDYNEESGYWKIPLIQSGESIKLTMRGTVNLGQNNNSITAYANIRSYNQNDSDFTNNAATVVVDVLDNEAPVISELNDVIIELNGVSPTISFAVSDANVNANLLNITTVSSDQSIVANSNIVVTGGGPNRSLVITPETDQFGVVNISVTVDDGVCSTTESFLLYVGNIWLGNTTNWLSASNWSTSVPDNLISAVIPENPSGGNFPVINNDVDVKNIIINNNANVNINAGRSLNVYGNFSNLGGDYTGNGNVRFTGLEPQWLFGKVSGLIINNSNNVSLANNLVTERAIDLQSGQLIVGDYSLTIRNPLIGNPNNLIMNATSSLVVRGTASGISIPSNIIALEDLELENGSGLTLNNSMQINDSLNLFTGTLSLGTNSLELMGYNYTTNGRISSNDGATLSVNSAVDAGKIIYDNTSNELSNLSVNVPAGSFEIENTVVVNTQLNLLAGKLISTNGLVHVNNTAPSALLVATDAYIVGTLRRCVTTSIDYALPVGSRDFKQAVNIHFNSMSESSCIDVFFTEKNADPTFADIGALNLTVGGNLVEQVLDYGFWTINATNTAGIYNYKLSVTSQGHLNGNEIGNHILLKRENSSSSWGILGEYTSENEGGSFTDAITVSRTNLTGFSDFAVGASTMGPLPVELLNFDAEQKESKVLLKWSTASEKNNSHFEVQKSANGIDFETIGMVQGNGNSTSVLEYEYADYGAHGNISHYRLQQFDFDGAYEFSPVVKVEFTSTMINVKLYPNPATEYITIHSDQSIESSIIQFVNTAGQIVKKEAIESSNGISLDISDLETGYYQVIIWSKTENGLTSSNTKFLKK